MSEEKDEVVGGFTIFSSGPDLPLIVADRIGEMLLEHPDWEVLAVSSDEAHHMKLKNRIVFVTVQFTLKKGWKGAA